MRMLTFSSWLGQADMMCKMPSGFLKRLASYEEEKPTKTYLEQESYRNEAAWSWKDFADVMQHTISEKNI